MDRTLLAAAGMSGSASCWIVGLSLIQSSMRPTASPSNVAFLLVVSFTIVTLLLKRRRSVGPDSTNRPTSGPVAVQRRQLLIAGGVCAFGLMLLSTVSERFADPGAATIQFGQEATLAGIAGVGLLALFLRREVEVRRSGS